MSAGGGIGWQRGSRIRGVAPSPATGPPSATTTPTHLSPPATSPSTCGHFRHHAEAGDRGVPAEARQRPSAGRPGGHVGLQGALAIAEKRGQPSIVYLEDAADGRVTDEPEIVEQVTLRVKSPQTGALSAAASQDLIARLAEERWKRSALT